MTLTMNFHHYIIQFHHHRFSIEIFNYSRLISVKKKTHLMMLKSRNKTKKKQSMYVFGFELEKFFSRIHIYV